ncbi:MAG: phosphoadenylyl-sulfate reductase [Leptolyngbyaceae cyanobacterium MO_188.B28]|nr:phosphoadenylyl-sulfate reductase [Leptolyngbyaceae cyanobacterium MO_188.B28]
MNLRSWGESGVSSSSAIEMGERHNQSVNGRSDAIALKSALDLTQINQTLEELSSAEIVQWAADTFGSGLAMSTSFGIQSAVMLHLVTRIAPDIPVIWIDTGYLPAETYQFAERLAERLTLNLKVYQSAISPARMEALYGQLWRQNDVDAFNRYDQIRKVEPMQRALTELRVTAWLAGLRRGQTQHRQTLPHLSQQSGRYKVLPILNWHAKDVYEYLQKYDLPYHPYFDQGYTTVGDWHSSRPLSATDEHERDTRFQGLKQECGLHLPQTPGEAASLDSSSL